MPHMTVHLLLLTVGLSGVALSVPFKPADPIDGANGMVLTEFAKEPFLKNPVGLGVDEQGRVFVTSVVRRKAADLDIRQFRQWIEKDLSLRTIADKRAHYRRELTPENGKNYKRIGDQNKDGQIDWKDLTVLSDRIIRLEDKNGDGVADEAITFADGFNTEVTGIAAGVTAWDGKVYATVEPDAWVLEDSTGDGVADRRESLAHGFSVHVAYAGHNFSGPVIGPDGRIYFSAADKGMNVTTADGVTHAHPHSGSIARCELDGSNFEVFAYGLRNVQEPAFDQFGNLFGVDNDGDMKGEKERFLYIVEGGDTGWRCNWQYRGKGYQVWQEEGLDVPEHPKQAAYIVPCLQTYRDGPTGFTFNPGTALNEHYRDHFFMTAFPSRKLYAFQVKRKGAAFEMTGEHLVASGVLMTGINLGPDGALYIADWSAKGYELNEKGGVWKMDDPEEAGSALRKETAALLAADWSKPETAKLLELLGHPDQRVRMKAQFEVVRRKDAGYFMTVAQDQKKPLLARVHAIWGLGQHLRLNGVLWGDPYFMLFQDPNPEIRAQAARTAGDSGHGELVNPAPLVALLKDPEERPRLLAAIALGRLKHREAVAPLVSYLADHGADPFHRHGGMMGLLGCATPAELAALAGHESKPVRLAAVVALRRLRAAEASVFLNDADPMVVAEAARAIHDDESIPAALPDLARLLESADDHEEATIRRALSAAIRLRQPEFAGLVAQYAAQESRPEELRLQALALLGDWSEPGRLDTVEGCYRPLSTVPISKIRPAVAPALEKLLESGSKKIADEARRVAAVYGIGTNPKELFATIENDESEAGEALTLLATRDDKRYRQGAALAIKSKHAPVRAVALEALAAIDPAGFPKLAAERLREGELVEQRAALRFLGESRKEEAAVLLQATLSDLKKGAVAPELALDVLEAAEANPAGSVKAALASCQSVKDGNDPLSPYLETLHGGDPLKGADIFNTHVAAQCVRCHQVEGAGSNVGPALGKIGEKDPRYLLEALVAPGAVVAPGYGITTVTLKSGESITANLSDESDESVELLMPDGSKRVLPKAEIASRTPPASSMPPMGLILQKRELRDLLAYLYSLK